MKREDFFHPADRYLYDFKVCTYAKGWAQLDTRQDASYFGNWVNPTERKLLSYTEGDVSLVTCDTDEEFVAEVRRTCEFYEQIDGRRPGIDPGFDPAMKQMFEAIGLADWLH